MKLSCFIYSTPSLNLQWDFKVKFFDYIPTIVTKSVPVLHRTYANTRNDVVTDLL